MPTKLDHFIEVLDSLPDDEVLTVPEVQSTLGINRRETIYDWARRNVRLSFYSCIVPSKSGSQYFFGNPRAIIAVRERFVTIGE